MTFDYPSSSDLWFPLDTNRTAENFFEETEEITLFDQFGQPMRLTRKKNPIGFYELNER